MKDGDAKIYTKTEWVDDPNAQPPPPIRPFSVIPGAMGAGAAAVYDIQYSGKKRVKTTVLKAANGKEYFFDREYTEEEIKEKIKNDKKLQVFLNKNSGNAEFEMLMDEDTNVTLRKLAAQIDNDKKILEEIGFERIKIAEARKEQHIEAVIDEHNKDLIEKVDKFDLASKMQGENLFFTKEYFSNMFPELIEKFSESIDVYFSNQSKFEIKKYEQNEENIDVNNKIYNKLEMLDDKNETYKNDFIFKDLQILQDVLTKMISLDEKIKVRCHRSE